MPQVTRLNDTGLGTCPDHTSDEDYTTRFISGAVTVFTNNIPTVIINSVGESTCGHPTHAVTGSPNVFVENVPVHRVNDVGTNPGPYNAVTGSPDVFAN